jgi:hypothetical protein
MVILSRKTVTLFFFSIFFIAVEIRAMFSMGAKHKVTPQERQKAMKAIKALGKKGIIPATSCEQNQVLLYPADTKFEPTERINGVCFSEDIIEQSKTMKNMIEDLGGKENFWGKKIPIPSSLKAIQNSHDILTQYDQGEDDESKKNNVKKAIDSYSFQQLNDTANCIDHLNCPPNINKVLLESMKQKLLESRS